ncbi:MAG: inositol monophosphatase [Deltaproteobacteria bacterium]|nr:inositol monophosphatase [Deltaproteobacteria bacterium]
MMLSAGDLTAAMQAAHLAADAAARIQLDGLRQARQVSHKGRYDLVTEIDQASEAAILPILQKALPKAEILAEETANQSDRNAPLIWLVDPLDGTTNYAHGYPAFCSTIALRAKGQTLLGLIHDPLRNERFEALIGQGAKLNKQAIHTSPTRQLAQSLLATGFPADRCEQPETNLERFAALTMQCRGVRRGGSAALDLSYTACGRLDGYWELRIFPWDVCAGALIVQEAGGKVSQIDGSPFDGSGGNTLASNGPLHSDLMDALAGA